MPSTSRKALEPHKRGDSPREGGLNGRISAKLRRAIDIIALEGQTQVKAAQRAGMHETSLSIALKKPHVRAYLDERKALAAMEADSLRGIARTLAIQTGIDLMQTSPSHAVRAKMVEFFAGEARGSAVNVQINTGPAEGYIYRKPASEAGRDDVQPIEIEGKATPVDD